MKITTNSTKQKKNLQDKKKGDKTISAQKYCHIL